MEKAAENEKISVIREPGMAALLSIVALGFTNFSLLLPISPSWAYQGGASQSQLGAITLLLMLATILTQTQVNRLLATIGWGKTLAAALIFLTLPALVQAISSDILLVLFTSLLRGIGFGLVTVCGSTALTYLVSESQRGKAVGAYGLSIAIPQFIFSSLAPTLMDWLGAQIVLCLSAIPLLGVFLAVSLGKRLDLLAYQGIGNQQKNVKESVFGAIWTSLLGLFLITSTGGALLTFAPQIASNSTLATTSLLLFTGLATPARWIMGSLSDKMNRNRLILFQGCLGALGAALLGLSVLSHLSFWLLMGAVLLGFSYGGLQSVTMVKAFADARERTANASVLWNITFDAGTGLGSMILGILAQNMGFGSALCLMATGALCATLIATGLARK